jgi:predicted nucleic acid-binding protein
MISLVVDASIAVKWVVEEEGTEAALAVRRKAKLIAPDLLAAECANILWKKARRGELSADEAILAAKLLQRVDLEFLPTRPFLERATRLAIELDHPAYDCLYLAMALVKDCQLVTADEHLLRKLERDKKSLLSGRAISLARAATDG